MARDRGAEIIARARELGADMAGIAAMERIKVSPSHALLTRFGACVDGVANLPDMEDFREPVWPPGVKSAVVIAVSHPESQPQLDWFETSGNTPGNRILIHMVRELAAWVEEALGIVAHNMPYYVEKGGVFLKDAAVLAGLGCIGKSNLLVTPEFGPRVRLRAMLLEAELTPTGPTDFDPCHDCFEPCRAACPEKVFGRVVLSLEKAGVEAVPARDGRFGRALCMNRSDKEMKTPGQGDEVPPVTGLDNEELSRLRRETRPVCRICEFACLVGQ